MDRRKLSKKLVNIKRRQRYANDKSYREKIKTIRRSRYQQHPEPEVLILDGVEYILVTKAAKMLAIPYSLLRRLQTQGGIPDLPRHPDGRRFIIRLSNVKVLSKAIAILNDEEERIFFPNIMKMRNYIIKNWNIEEDNVLTFTTSNTI